LINQNQVDPDLERLEAGGDAWSASEPLDERVEVKRPLGVVVRVQLTRDQYRRLGAAAAEAGLDPSALLHSWALEKLGGQPAVSHR
jgi:hypothetical protein